MGFADVRSHTKKYDLVEYRRLHWQAGYLGQLLYVNAHAFGGQATGMGCFVDPLAVDVFGFAKSDFLVLYHFAVGYGAKDDRVAPFDYEHDMFDTVNPYAKPPKKSDK